MDAITSSQRERAEVDALYQSGLFEKAPRLGTFFSYICDRYFAGKAEQIKEYTIAIEALGRPVEFDSKRDSIVRVEAHRLRKRLDDFYKGPGATHTIQIVIPNGQYRPHFILKQTELATPLPDLPLPPPSPVICEPPAVQAVPFKPPARSWQLAAGVAALLLSLIAVWFFAWHNPLQ